MDDLRNLLKKLLTTPGLSGYEAPIRALIEAIWQPLTNEIQTSPLGSVQALKRGQLAEPRPSVLLAAHMDSIGLMVTGITDGFLRITNVGGIDPRVLPGQTVTIHSRQRLPGLVVLPPVPLLPEEFAASPPPLEYLLVDTGLHSKTVEQQVNVGDLITIDLPPTELSDDVLVGHPLDNRASIAALTSCLWELRSRQLLWDMWAVATIQEEETYGGAHTSAFQLRPTIAVVIDVTFGSSPGSPAHKTYPIQKGITLGWGPNIHPKLHKIFKELAGRLEIPHKDEVMPHHSGTDAFAIQVAAEGIPTMVVSIPLRYMHTPVEMVSLKDIIRTGRLLAEFVVSLDENFSEKLRWAEHD